jgi:hypothetical protein
MKSLHLVSIILGFATIGLSLPAQADQAVSNETVQTAIVTGSNNSVSQRSNSVVIDSGRNSSNNSGTAIRTRQVADVQGDNNTVNQSSDTRVENRRDRRRYRY